MVIGHFLKNTSFVLASFAYFDRLDHSLHFLLKYHAQSADPFFGHFVSKLCVFVPFSNRVILERAALYESVFMSK